MLWFNFNPWIKLFLFTHYPTLPYPKQRKIEFKHIHYTPTTGKFSKE